MSLWHHDILEAENILFTLKDSDLSNYPKGLSEFYTNNAVFFYTYGVYDSSKYNYKLSLNLIDSLSIETDFDVLALYLKLLIRKSDYKEIQQIADSLLSISFDGFNEKPSLNLVLIDFLIEQNDLTRANLLLNQLEEYFIQDAPNQKLKADYFSVLARYLASIGDFEKALLTMHTSSRMYAENNDNLQIGMSYYYLGKFYVQFSDYRNANKYLNMSIDVLRSQNYKTGLALAQLEMGKLLSILVVYSDAISYFYSAKSIFEEQGNIRESVISHSEMAWIYIKQGFFNKAEEYLRKAIVLSVEHNDHYSLAYAYNIFGTYFKDISQLDSALFYYTAALDISRTNNIQAIEAASLFNQSLLIIDKDLGLAKNMQLEAYRIEKDLGNKLGMAVSEIYLANIYMKEGDYKLAKEKLDISRERLYKLNAKDYLINNLLYSAQLYEKQGDYRQSNNFLNEYIKYSSDIYSSKTFDKVAELEARNSIREKENEIVRLKLEEESRKKELALKEVTISNQKLYIYFSLAVILFSIGFLILTFRLLRTRSKNNANLLRLNKEIDESQKTLEIRTKELEEAYEEISILNENLEEEINKRTKELKEAYRDLDMFFYRAAHDFRGPISTFLGLTELAKNSVKEKEALHLFDKVFITAKKIESMVSKLNAMSLISTRHKQKNIINLAELIDIIIIKYSSELNFKSIKIENNVDKKLQIKNIEILAQLILENLIENAIQFTSTKQGEIKVESSLNDKQLIIKVIDNGDGIPDLLEDKVFELYFRAHEASKGNGLGLYIVKKAAESMNIEVNIERNNAIGTCFRLFIPLNQVVDFSD